jgi:hypothetical protein
MKQEFNINIAEVFKRDKSIIIDFSVQIKKNRTGHDEEMEHFGEANESNKGRYLLNTGTINGCIIRSG